MPEKCYVCDNAQLMAEWDPEKNNAIGNDPTKLYCGSRKYAWWICSKGHSYKARLDAKNRGTTCPYCANRQVLPGYNDVATLFPSILLNWDYEANLPLKPNEIVAGSRTKVFLKCDKNHCYQMTVRDYTLGYGCPVCNGKKVVQGVNDFASTNKRLLLEWDYRKNNINPTEITSNYYRKVWWIGQCGHSWEASVYSRTKMGTNCPICAEERHSSVAEKTIAFYLKKSDAFINILENYKDENIQLELDIYIPEIRTAIEYDGERWHRHPARDLHKDVLCEKNGIKLIRIREKGCPYYDSNSEKIFLSNNKTNGVEEGLLQLFDTLSLKKIDINIDRDMTEILSMINFMVKEQSISVTHPEIAKEWHPSKNGNLKPEHTKPNSNKKVWWICKKGHEYQMEVYARTKRNNSCPICSGHKVLVGFNDLLSQDPTLAKEWNYSKNGDLLPEQVTSSSGKKVWWICNKGHEWQTTISHRRAGQGCPVCSGKKVQKGYNDLASQMPHLMEEWDYQKNIFISPEAVSVHSGKKVWWKCKKCGFNWQATIDKRSNGRKCPKCAKRHKNEVE